MICVCKSSDDSAFFFFSLNDTCHLLFSKFKCFIKVISFIYETFTSFDECSEGVMRNFTDSLCSSLVSKYHVHCFRVLTHIFHNNPWCVSLDHTSFRHRATSKKMGVIIMPEKFQVSRFFEISFFIEHHLTLPTSRVPLVHLCKFQHVDYIK